MLTPSSYRPPQLRRPVMRRVARDVRCSLRSVRFFWVIWCCGISAISGCEESPPQNVLDGEPWEVVLTGDDFSWVITDPGPDGALGTSDDLVTSPPLHLPAGTSTRLILNSRDYIYTLEIPEFQLKEIAIPDLKYTLEFTTGKPGEMKFRGDQYCGYAHSGLSGTMMLQTWSDYRRWQQSVRAESDLTRTPTNTSQ